VGGDRRRFLPHLSRRHIESCNAKSRSEQFFSRRSVAWPGLVSCNAKEPDFPTGSSGCVNIISCNGSPIKAGFRQYPGFFTRHACTRSTCCSPRKYSMLLGFRSQRRWLDCLLAAWHSGSEQYFCRLRRRGSRLNNFWQHRHRRRRGLITGFGSNGGPNDAQNCAASRRCPSLRGDSHRRYHRHRCRHGIVIAVPANDEKRSRSRWNRVHVPLESAFTMRWKP
jgi:hypothetical protein